MKTNFINSTNYYDALQKIIEKIGKRKITLGVRHLLFVPEKYTLLAERYLCAKLGGSFDVEVLSPSRLFRKMDIQTPALGREGAIMLLRGMLPSLELKCFSRSATYRGFCEKLYDAINDFAANGVLPIDIPSSSPKLSDLRMIYEEYLKRIQGRFVDSIGKLELVARQAETSEYLNNVHVYVANYDYMDKATRKVYDALKNRAISYTETIVTDDAELKLNALSYVGDGAMAVKEVAKQLRFLAYGGIKYEDMAIIVGNADRSRIRRILGEFDVPCFMAEDKRLSDFPLSAFLLKLFECSQRKSRDCFVELSKNAYSGVEKSDSDVFENYVNSRLVDYKRFFESFEDCPQAEDVRAKLATLCSFAEKKLKRIKTASEFGQALNDVLTFVDAQKTTEELYESDAVVEKTKAIASLMEQVGISGNFDFISAVFAEGLRASKVSTIPYEGGVMVGDAASLRGGKYEFTAVIGFDDGFLPQTYRDNSLVGDDEKTSFTQMERAEQINARYETELRLALAKSKRIFITYSTPSAMIGELFKGLFKLSEDDQSLLLRSGCKKHAIELLISLVGKNESNVQNDTKLINDLYEATDVGEEMFIQKRSDVVKNGRELFFLGGATSVSQLQSYFRCPFRHYAEYGLRLKHREEGRLTPLDVGSFMHLIAEKVTKRGEYDDIKDAVEQAVNEILLSGGKLALDVNASTVNALKAEAIEALKIYASHLKKGSFVPLGQEIEFETELGDVKLRGKIDSADVYENYVRLIDHKTGSYEFNLGDVYYGKKIQLPLYLAAMSKKGYKKAAMLNYPFSYNWLSDEFDHRFSGFVLKDEQVMKAVDCNCDQGDSDVFNFNPKSSSLLTESEMDAVINYANALSVNAVNEIKDGYVAATPLKDECDYCVYKCLCVNKKQRKTAKIYKTAFTEKVGEE